MKNPNIQTLKKYLNALSKIKGKYVTAERLSRSVGVYPEIICENLSYFEPTLMLDNSFNLLEIVPDIKKYIVDEEEKKANNLLFSKAPWRQSFQGTRHSIL